jgi:DNA-binding transcriptional LysR family regulator
LLVHSEDLVLAVPAAHPLAVGEGPVALVDVTDDYIGYSPEGSQYLHDICAAMIGMDRYAVSQLASQVPTMLALVRAGLGCALIPRSIMAMGVEGVRSRELDAADAHSVTLHACWSPDSPNPALQRLAESLRENPHLDA